MQDRRYNARQAVQCKTGGAMQDRRYNARQAVQCKTGGAMQDRRCNAVHLLIACQACTVMAAIT